jgi:hypothetical protein
MGIQNVTPDSFSDGGRIATRAAPLRQAESMHTLDIFVIAHETLIRSIPTNLDDADRQRNLFTARPLKDARSVPALGEQGEHPDDRVGHPEPLGEYPGNLTQGGDVPGDEAGRLR